MASRYDYRVKCDCCGEIAGSNGGLFATTDEAMEEARGIAECHERNNSGHIVIPTVFPFRKKPANGEKT